MLRDVIVLAFDDLVEAAHGVDDFYITSLDASELLGDVEGLGEELLHLARAGHSQAIVFAQLFDAEDGDDVLQIFVALQDSLYALCDRIVLLANDAGLENA